MLAREGIDSARRFAAEARRRLAGRALGATLSCGAASVGTGARRPADLLRAADAAQYAAKRAGVGRPRVPGVAQPQSPTGGAVADRRSRREAGRPDLADLTSEAIELLCRGDLEAALPSLRRLVLEATAAGAPGEPRE